MNFIIKINTEIYSHLSPMLKYDAKNYDKHPFYLFVSKNKIEVFHYFDKSLYDNYMEIEKINFDKLKDFDNLYELLKYENIEYFL